VGNRERTSTRSCGLPVIDPHLAPVVKAYSTPAIGHRNVTVFLRVLAGVE
jgi:hypothetical protein